MSMRGQRQENALRLSLGAPPDHRLSARLLVAVAMTTLLAAAVAGVHLGIAYALFIVLAVGALGFARLGRRQSPSPRGSIVSDPAGIERIDEQGRTRIVRWAEPFGLTLFANPAQTRVVFAFTTPRWARYLGVRTDATAPARELLASAITMPDVDLVVPGGDHGALLAAGSAITLLRTIRARAPLALDRLYLTTPSGELVTLDGAGLRVGDTLIDLTSPLEWRGFLFHQSTGAAASIFQATWVRQGDAELMLVAASPLELPWSAPATASGRDGRGVRVRDARGPAGPAHELAREQRFAVDRLFMSPLRKALARAPRTSHPSVPPARTRPEGRA